MDDPDTREREERRWWAKVQAALLGSMQRFFFQQVGRVVVKWVQGRLVGRHPILFILLPLAITAVCCGGFARLLTLTLHCTVSRDNPEIQDEDKFSFLAKDLDNMAWVGHTLPKSLVDLVSTSSILPVSTVEVKIIITATNVLEPSVVVATLRLLEVLLGPDPSSRRSGA